MNTFTAEATVAATGTVMWQDGLTAGQVAQLRQAEADGKITGLTVEKDVDLVAAFGGAAVLA